MNSNKFIEKEQPLESPSRFEFAEFSFDTAKKLLRRGAEIVPLAPKACELLNALIINAPEVLSKEELMNQVWNDSFVEEANLTHHISALRKALGEDKNGRKFIETIPRKGYRFVAEVENLNNHAAEIIISERITDYRSEEIEIETSDELTLPKRLTMLEDGGRARSRFPIFAAAGILLAAFGGLAFYLFAMRGASGETNSRSSAPISYTPVSDGRDVGIATVSPDGKFVAYIQNYNVGDGGTLFVRQLETNRESRLLEPDERTFGNIDFSPDGSQIYYVSFEKGAKISSIYSISILGGKPKRLFNLDSISAYFAVSPDGKQIAFYRNDAATGTTSLIVAALDGGAGSERIVHTHPMSEPSFWGWLAWSPDSRFLALTRAPTSDTQHDSRIFSFDLQTGEAAALHEQSFANIGKMVFRPDGREIFFVGKIDGSVQKIYVLDLASRQIRRVTNDTNPYGNYGLGITADGKTLAADLMESKADLWSVAASGEMTDVRRVKQGDTNGRRGLAAFPDGRIAYVVRVGDRFDVWTVKADGSDAQPLTADAFQERGLTASKDGRFLVFSSDRAGGANKYLYRTNADGSDLKQLTFGETADTQPDFSPDGNWIVYVSQQNGISIIKKISVESGTPIHLTDYYGICPAFSPDGTRIALKFMSSSRSLPGEVAVISATGGKPEKTFPVTDFEFVDTATPIRWTPDGAGLIFRRERNSVGNLWQQNLDNSPPRQLTDFTSDTIYNFVYSTDGTRILLSRGLYQTNAVLIQNFGQ